MKDDRPLVWFPTRFTYADKPEQMRVLSGVVSIDTDEEYSLIAVRHYGLLRIRHEFIFDTQEQAEKALFKLKLMQVNA